MSKTYEGIVSEVSATPWKDRDTNDDIVLHSFRLEDNNQWFRTGQKDPSLTAGDGIKFVTTRGQNVDVGSIEQLDPSKVTKPKPAASAGSSQGDGGARRASPTASMTRNSYWEEKDRYDKEVRQPMIAFQSARRDAVDVVTAALAADILSLGQKKADKLDLLIGYIDEVTDSMLERYKSYEENLNG